MTDCHGESLSGFKMPEYIGQRGKTPPGLTQFDLLDSTVPAGQLMTVTANQPTTWACLFFSCLYVCRRRGWQAMKCARGRTAEWRDQTSKQIKLSVTEEQYIIQAKYFPSFQSSMLAFPRLWNTILSKMIEIHSHLSWQLDFQFLLFFHSFPLWDMRRTTIHTDTTLSQQ